MHEFSKFDQQQRWLGALVELLFEDRERRRDIALHQGLEDVDHARAVGDAEHIAHGVLGDRIPGDARTMRNRLIQQRQGVPNGALRRPGDERQRLVADAHALAITDGSKVRHHQAGINAAQVKPLATRANRDRNLVDLGGREQELHMRRRLFQGLEQAVERGLRQHVNFVDDEHLVTGHHRLVAGALDDLANIVDAGVGRRVHLDHVDVARLDDRRTVNAQCVHVDGRPRDRGGAIVRGKLVVEGAGENARRGRLADAANAGENVGLVYAINLERVAQRPDHRILADKIVKGRGTILAREHPVGAGTLP